MAEAVSSQLAASGSEPKITVAIPVFNAGRHLRLAVLSIVGQSFSDWELLIIDDGSTDNAFQGIADIHDCRIRILRDGDNKGLACRLNQALDLARGQYFARMDQDDVSYPERFAFQLELFASNSDLDVAAVRAVTISENNEIIGRLPAALSHTEICARPWLGFYFPHPTWMGRVAWFRAHRYTCPGPYFCEDQELLLRSYTQSRFATVDRVLFAYRVREGIHWKKQSKTRRTLFNIQLRYFLGGRQLNYAVLSLVGFVGRVVSDLLNIFHQFLFGVRHLFRRIDLAEMDVWRDVLNKILGKSF